MDENRPAFSLKAPGSSSGYSLHLPGRGSFPPVDEHLVEAEVTRDEIIGGRRVVAMPAHPPHANRQFKLDYVLNPHIAPGYIGAADLLTRVDFKSDFASDACVYKDEIDPQTGTRYLEEIAFEVVSEQNEGDVTEKALRMHQRGVRRIFAIFVKGELRVCEWSSEGRSWRLLDPDSLIEDPCLALPLKVAALLDAAVADNAVAEALVAKGNPVIRRREAAARSEGKAEGLVEGKAEGLVVGKVEGLVVGKAEGLVVGKAEGLVVGKAEGLVVGKVNAVLQFLEARGVPVSPAQRQEILRCGDLDRLDRWVRRAASASSADELLAER